MDMRPHSGETDGHLKVDKPMGTSKCSNRWISEVEVEGPMEISQWCNGWLSVLKVDTLVKTCSKTLQHLGMRTEEDIVPRMLVCQFDSPAKLTD